MDNTDRRLLAILRTDGRASISKLAELLKISRGTVQNRIDRLTADGGDCRLYTVRIAAAEDPAPPSAPSC